MTQTEFDLLSEGRPDSKAREAARRVLVLGEKATNVASDLGISRGNVSDVCARYLKLKAKLDKWEQR